MAARSSPCTLVAVTLAARLTTSSFDGRVTSGSRALVGQELPIGGGEEGIAYYPSVYVQSTLSQRCAELRPTRDTE